MDLRLLEIIIPSKTVESLWELVEQYEILDGWEAPISEELTSVQLLLPSTKTEPISDAIGEQFDDHERFRILFYNVQATIPEPAREEDNDNDGIQKDDAVSPLTRISREELYAEVVSGVDLSITFLITVLLSALVAAIGLLSDDVAVIIGAMVIAPLLRPNVALSLAVSLGDIDLIKKSLLINVASVVTSFFLAVFIGVVFQVDPENTQISIRANVSISNILLAIVVGVTGALAFTTGVSASLIGVMVAVALLPPLVASGLLFGAGYFDLAYNAFFLFLINVTGLNLATVVTFLAQGVQPRKLLEAEKAKQATRIAIIFWVLLTLAFVVLIGLLRI